MMKSLPYDQAVDWLTFGVMISEMIVGDPPFFYDELDSDDNSAEERLYQKILNDEVDFPEDMSLAVVLIVNKVSVITTKHEALICHSLLYALATFSLKMSRTGLILSV
jgi:serine/threonine protein kinase